MCRKMLFLAFATLVAHWGLAGPAWARQWKPSPLQTAFDRCAEGALWVNHLRERYEYRTPLRGCG